MKTCCTYNVEKTTQFLHGTMWVIISEGLTIYVCMLYVLYVLKDESEWEIKEIIAGGKTDPTEAEHH